MEFSVAIIETKAYNDQNPGTSGLRKKCKVFLQENYTENFIQSILTHFPAEGSNAGPLIVGGDGRYFCKEAAVLAVKIAAGNRFKRVIVCQSGIGSTPAISRLINLHNAVGGIILTASHNPGGPDQDFGIKFNVASGGGAPEGLTKLVFETSLSLKQYSLCPSLEPNLDIVNSKSYKIVHPEGDIESFEVQVIDSTDDYVKYMQEIFDFSKLKHFVSSGYNGNPIKLLIDARNGVAGPYIHSIFCRHLGCPEGFLRNFRPLEDFGGLHPDPNLTYANDFVEEVKKSGADFGAAFDGDADRCMIIGSGGYFVSPSDSVAVIAANAAKCVPYFERGQLRGVARSMPTSSALDRVAEVLSHSGSGFHCYEVPTGWKFFCNLMDAGKVDISGEESFGAGSSHLREKDGIWTALVWLSIMANQRFPVQTIIENHWMTFGRHYYTRYDYEGLTTEEGLAVITGLLSQIDSNLEGREFESNQQVYKVLFADNFSYEDPVDNSVSSGQGLRVVFTNKDRIIVRLSGTGSQGSTLRVYVEHFEDEAEKMFMPATEALSDLIAIALQLTNIKQLTGRDQPTVIT